MRVLSKKKRGAFFIQAKASHKKTSETQRTQAQVFAIKTR
jgi:hypothetical protein